MPASEAWQRGITAANAAECAWETLRESAHEPATAEELKGAIEGSHFQIRIGVGQVRRGGVNTSYICTRRIRNKKPYQGAIASSNPKNGGEHFAFN